jgi:uncharacterized membrane protein YebE (DUF533 family)
MNLLDQLLKSGTDMARKAASGQGNFATGAITGGALGLLLGTRRGRSVGGKVLKYGSLAALGALAYKAYNDWQAQQQASQSAAGAGSMPAQPARPAPAQLPAPQAEAESRAVLRAMIAAAKADGHFDDREREQVEAELGRQLGELQSDAETRSWFEAELRRPVEPAEVAAAATSPEMAAELYLASLLVVDETTTMERAYLDELARRLNLAPALKADLESKAAAV